MYGRINKNHIKTVNTTNKKTMDFETMTFEEFKKQLEFFCKTVPEEIELELNHYSYENMLKIFAPNIEKEIFSDGHTDIFQIRGVGKVKMTLQKPTLNRNKNIMRLRDFITLNGIGWTFQEPR